MLAEDDLLERERRGLRVAEEQSLLVGQERAGPRVATHAQNPDGVAHARNEGRERLETVGLVRQRVRLPAAGLDDAGEVRVEKGQELADH